MTDDVTSRRATDPRGELFGSTASATMAILFAFVVIFGKQVAAGNLPFVMLSMRFGGQSILLLLALRVFRRPFLPAKGERLPLAIAANVARAARTAAGVGCGKLASSECTAVRQRSARKPARISRS